VAKPLRSRAYWEGHREHILKGDNEALVYSSFSCSLLFPSIDEDFLYHTILS
jgi:hypothetical protein